MVPLIWALRIMVLVGAGIERFCAMAKTRIGRRHALRPFAIRSRRGAVTGLQPLS